MKQILKIILTLTLYEAAKYITEQYIIYRTQNDEVKELEKIEVYAQRLKEVLAHE